MYSNNRTYLFLLLLFASILASAQDQSVDRTTFRLVGEIGGGYSYKLTPPKIILGNSTRDGITGTFRVKWGSSNLLGVGVETGYIPISTMAMNSLASEFGSVDVSASLSAIPVLAIFTIQRLGIQMHTGIGYYRMTAKATVMGKTMESSEWNMGYMLSFGFTRPLTSDLFIGTELKWNNIVEQRISILSLQVRFLYFLYGK